MPQLPTRPLGSTDVEVTVAGLGTAPLGGLFDAVGATESGAVLDAAWDAGVRYFDTAPWYGFGRAERRVGDALRRRSGYSLSTKAGRILRPSTDPPGARHGWPDPLPFAPHHDYGYDGVRRSFEDSLQRLGLARIDVLLLHDIGAATHADANGPLERDAFDGGLRALQDLRSEGAIGAIGIGVNETDVLLRALDVGAWDVFLLAGRYTLLEQAALDALLPACERAGTSIVIGGAFNSGLLAGGSTWNYAPAPPEMLARRDALAGVCRDHGVALEAAALQFVLGHPAVASVLLGCRHRSELDANLTHLRAEIPQELWGALRSRGLLDEGAPTPGAPPL